MRRIRRRKGWCSVWWGPRAMAGHAGQLLSDGPQSGTRPLVVGIGKGASFLGLVEVAAGHVLDGRVADESNGRANAVGDLALGCENGGDDLGWHVERWVHAVDRDDGSGQRCGL